MLRRPQPAARRRARVIVACVLCVWLSIGSASAAPTGVTIEDSTIQGDGIIATENDLPYLADWEPANITVDIAANNGVYRVCVEAEDGTDRQSLTCERVENSGQTATATLPVNTSSIDASGQRTLSVVVREPTGSDDEPLATEPQQVTVLPAGGDFDNDGLNNKRERERGTDLRTADSDGDGLTDSQEVNIYHTNPLQRDTDDDGLGDGIEVNEYGTNPTDPDEPIVEID